MSVTLDDLRKFRWVNTTTRVKLSADLKSIKNTESCNPTGSEAVMLSEDIQSITLRDFLDHLDTIPEEKWGPVSLSPARPCVMAILGVSTGSPPDAGLLAKRLLEVTGDIEFMSYWELINKKNRMSGLEIFRSIPRVVRVNRGEDSGYQQATPKQRVLSYLRSVVAEIEKLEK